MTIRNIITAAAMVAVLGLAGGSAYADGHDDAALVENSFIASADANYPGIVYVYEGDESGHDGELLPTDGFERADLPQEIVESLLY